MKKKFPCLVSRGDRRVRVDSDVLADKLAPLLNATPQGVIDALAKGHTLRYGAVEVVALIRPATAAELSAAFPSDALVTCA
ncbi:hypothetical protein N5E86_15970 [Stutzerimonas stutzeri]|uniref:hypothetical protein n=1 Tax=Stutzerimonas stutzeri TaxID=316 RepID=UPI00244A7614|nr:hypothetical protein [Stutzerimonas stutzeri]MDH1555951.1 hypothetical protein [Stutzerimonas stutzeri]